MAGENKPKVSVVIPAYNAGSLLRDAMESVFRQTFHDWEVVVVDDGSTVPAELPAGCCGDRVRHHRQANRGAAAARNLGIREASGEFIAFLDADDIWLPTKLAEQIPLLEGDPGVGLAYTDWAVVSEEGTVIPSFLSGKPRASGNAFEALVQCGVILTSGTMTRKSCLEAVGGFDETRGVAEDYDLWLRIAYGWKIAVVEKPLVIKRSRRGSLSSNPHRMALERVALFQKALRSFPQLSAKHRRLLRHELMRSYWDVGYGDLVQGALGSARQQFARSLKAEWTSTRAWIYLLASCLPAKAVRAIRRAKQSARRHQPAEAASSTAAISPEEKSRLLKLAGITADCSGREQQLQERT